MRTGGKWVELRLCLTCGHVGCCNSSPGRHAEQHFASTGHPIIRAFSQAEDWAWCYADEAYLGTEEIDQALDAGHRHQLRASANQTPRLGFWMMQELGLPMLQ
ncbi:UBP-type zinc finger domain-containing protein [Vulgatibacter incomptus]|uniref:UBP-type domain-containing protein n=1 Tax=Vulgatibacter incomptus TaxID=1391653 RepID=A0A0K1PDD6_9BACT|nr:UBP-type zinc finger domain-containing protein [Vulgatibacter incomptus]AKU91416.1 hypothetical protein AKJ08_1803 [Vulgatibacter incomptus]